jgi:hypothetical protein
LGLVPQVEDFDDRLQSLDCEIKMGEPFSDISIDFVIEVGKWESVVGCGLG